MTRSHEPDPRASTDGGLPFYAWILMLGAAAVLGALVLFIVWLSSATGAIYFPVLTPATTGGAR